MRRQSSTSTTTSSYSRSPSRSIPSDSPTRRTSSSRTFRFEDEKIATSNGNSEGWRSSIRDSPRRSSGSYDFSASPASVRASILRGTSERRISTPRRSSLATDNDVLSSTADAFSIASPATDLRRRSTERSMATTLPILPKKSPLLSTILSSSAPLATSSSPYTSERRPIRATEAMIMSGGGGSVGNDGSARERRALSREGSASARQRYEEAGGQLEGSLSSSTLSSSSRRLLPTVERGTGAGGDSFRSVKSDKSDEYERKLSTTGDGSHQGLAAADAAGSVTEEQSPSSTPPALSLKARLSGSYSPRSMPSTPSSRSSSASSSGRPPPSLVLSKASTMTSPSPRLITAMAMGINGPSPSPRRSSITQSITAPLPASLKKRALVGLNNLGNTCFLNSSLQCLLSTEPLVGFFAEGRQNSCLCAESPMKGQLASAFGELAALVCSMAHQVAANPAALKRVVGKWAPHFSGYEQQDSQEFLRFLLDGLSEDLNRATPAQKEKARKLTLASNCSPNVTLSGPDPATLVNMADAAWDRFLWHNNSVITDLFCGQLQSSVQCLTCGRWTFCFDPFMDISLPIPKEAEVTESKRRSLLGGRGLGSRGNGGSASLEECLKSFTDDEVLDGDDRVSCGHCKILRKSIKRLNIHRFPPILVLHIKRFRFNEYSREKLTTSIRYPLTGLDLTKYGTSNFQCITTTKPPIYDLYAVSNHMGGLGGGHYTAHCLCRSEGHSSSASSIRRTFTGYHSRTNSTSSSNPPAEDWHLFDDSCVSQTGASSLSGTNAYVLFYKQRCY